MGQTALCLEKRRFGAEARLGRCPDERFEP